MMARLAYTCLFSILFALTGSAQAQLSDGTTKFPSKPVKIVLGAAPGGGTDLWGRLIAQGLAARWNSPVVVDFMPGAQGGIANNYVAKSAPDGHTMQFGGSAVGLLGVFNKVSYDPRTALDFVIQVSRQAYIVLINPSIPAATLKEFVAYAKANPDKLTYGSTGDGGTVHLGTEYFKSVTGINMLHVPYKGLTPAMVDVMGGRLSFVFNASIASTAAIKSGKVRAIAVTGAQRMESFPDFPTVAESGFPGYAMETYYGLFAAAGTPGNILNFLHNEIAAVTNAKDFKELATKEGSEVLPRHSPAQFKAVFLRDYATNEKLVKSLGIVQQQ